MQTVQQRFRKSISTDIRGKEATHKKKHARTVHERKTATRVCGIHVLEKHASEFLTRKKN